MVMDLVQEKWNGQEKQDYIRNENSQPRNNGVPCFLQKISLKKFIGAPA